MGTDKRDRQKTARQAKIEAEMAAARKARSKRTAIRVAVAAVVVVGGLFAYSAIWGGDDEETAADDGSQESTTLPATPEPVCVNPTVSGAVGREAPETPPPPDDTAPDAVEITTLVEGMGEGAVAGDSIVAHYVGKTADGTVFDCSWDELKPGDPITVENLGQSTVIPGWNEGLVGVKLGERRRLVIGSDMAYGPEGNAAAGIPPDAPLAFEIDVVDVVRGGVSATTAPVTTAPADTAPTTTAAP